METTVRSLPRCNGPEAQAYFFQTRVLASFFAKGFLNAKVESSLKEIESS